MNDLTHLARIQAETAEIMRKLEAERPYAEIGRALAQIDALSIRDFVALMKDERGRGVKEREFIKFLSETYCYRCTRGKRKGRLVPHAQYAHLFTHQAKGFDGRVHSGLRLTGAGAMHLIPAVIARFGHPRAA